VLDFDAVTVRPLPLSYPIGLVAIAANNDKSATYVYIYIYVYIVNWMYQFCQFYVSHLYL